MHQVFWIQGNASDAQHLHLRSSDDYLLHTGSHNAQTFSIFYENVVKEIQSRKQSKRFLGRDEPLGSDKFTGLPQKSRKFNSTLPLYNPVAITTTSILDLYPELSNGIPASWSDKTPEFKFLDSPVRQIHAPAFTGVDLMAAMGQMKGFLYASDGEPNPNIPRTLFPHYAAPVAENSACLYEAGNLDGGFQLCCASTLNTKEFIARKEALNGTVNIRTPPFPSVIDTYLRRAKDLICLPQILITGVRHAGLSDIRAILAHVQDHPAEYIPFHTFASRPGDISLDTILPDLFHAASKNLKTHKPPPPPPEEFADDLVPRGIGNESAGESADASELRVEETWSMDEESAEERAMREDYADALRSSIGEALWEETSTTLFYDPLAYRKAWMISWIARTFVVLRDPVERAIVDLSSVLMMESVHALAQTRDSSPPDTFLTLVHICMKRAMCTSRAGAADLHSPLRGERQEEFLACVHEGVRNTRSLLPFTSFVNTSPTVNKAQQCLLDVMHPSRRSSWIQAYYYFAHIQEFESYETTCKSSYGKPSMLLAEHIGLRKEAMLLWKQTPYVFIRQILGCNYLGIRSPVHPNFRAQSYLSSITTDILLKKLDEVEHVLNKCSVPVYPGTMIPRSFDEGAFDGLRKEAKFYGLQPRDIQYPDSMPTGLVLLDGLNSPCFPGGVDDGDTIYHAVARSIYFRPLQRILGTSDMHIVFVEAYQGNPTQFEYADFVSDLLRGMFRFQIMGSSIPFARARTISVNFPGEFTDLHSVGLEEFLKSIDTTVTEKIKAMLKPYNDVLVAFLAEYHVLEDVMSVLPTLRESADTYYAATGTSPNSL